MSQKPSVKLKTKSIITLVAMCLGSTMIPIPATAVDSLAGTPASEQVATVLQKSGSTQCEAELKVTASATTVAPGETIHFSGHVRVYNGKYNKITVSFDPFYGYGGFHADMDFDPETGSIEGDVTIPKDAKPQKYALTWDTFFDDAGHLYTEDTQTVITVLNADGTIPDSEYQTKRYPGTDRYHTSLLIASDQLACGAPVFIASGEAYADALSATAAATKTYGGVVLTNRAKIDSSTMATLESKEPSQVYVIGGISTVSEEVFQQLKTITPNVNRIAGTDRYQTSEKIFEQFFAESAGRAFIATGTDFPDALTASAAAGSFEEPVLLVNGKTQEALPNSLREKILSSKVTHFTIVGGEKTITTKLETELESLGTVDRVQGADRYQTALALSNQLDDSFPTSQVKGVWLASGDTYADALSAAAFAGYSEQMLLLSHKDCLDSSVANKVNNNYAEKEYLYVVGGTKTLTSSVEELNTCN